MTDIKIDNIIRIENLGTVNRNKVVIGDLHLYFSYKTIVAFADGTGFYASKNIWSRTTARFLNDISDELERIDHEQFREKLIESLTRHNLLLEKIMGAL